MDWFDYYFPRRYTWPTAREERDVNRRYRMRKRGVQGNRTKRVSAIGQSRRARRGNAIGYRTRARTQGRIYNWNYKRMRGGRRKKYYGRGRRKKKYGKWSRGRWSNKRVYYAHAYGSVPTHKRKVGESTNDFYNRVRHY